jgi:hypothetical protein
MKYLSYKVKSDGEEFSVLEKIDCLRIFKHPEKGVYALKLTGTSNNAVYHCESLEFATQLFLEIEKALVTNDVVNVELCAILARRKADDKRSSDS